MRERPILFSSPMVRALLDGRKTMTRREIKNLDLTTQLSFHESYGHLDPIDRVTEKQYAYGLPGDLLWVRENWQLAYSLVGKPMLHEEQLEDIVFAADNPPASMMLYEKWRPSIHLKKIHSRIWLEISNIRIERLKDISENDAIAEGIVDYGDGTYKNYFNKKGLREADSVEAWAPIASFQSLWCSINGLESWDANPWVWVIEFKVLSTNGKPVAAKQEGAAV